MTITVSEQDFEIFCRAQRWSADKLDERDNIQTPDYRVTTPTGYQFIVEVTEFEPEPWPERGEIRVRHSTYGQRLRKKLQKKASQARALDTDEPTLIVVCGEFDRFSDLEPMAFDYAMYGVYTVPINVPADPAMQPTHGPTFQGGGRVFDDDHNTRVSAVAALFGRPHHLNIFHNRFAAIPLESSRLILQTERVHHYIKQGSEPGWLELHTCE